MLRLVTVALLVFLHAEGADSLVWHPKARTFDLDFRERPLNEFLGYIRSETGWEVRVEPGLSQLVDGKFRGKPAADAIRLMLGRTQFKLVPRTQGGTRLTVYSGNIRAATQEVQAVVQEAAAFEEVLVEGELQITLPVKIHYFKSKYASINADPNATDLRPLFAGMNEIWEIANLRFLLNQPELLRAADAAAEREFANLFTPDVPKAFVRQHQARILHKLLPDLPDKGKAFHIVLIYTMPDAYGAVYLPAKGVILMPQVKFAKLIDPKGVWKDGSPVFYAQSNILAHEMGHALSLNHVATQGNLMIDGRLREGTGIGPGVGLSLEQIEKARKQAKTKGPYVPGFNPKPRVRE